MSTDDVALVLLDVVLLSLSLDGGVVLHLGDDLARVLLRFLRVARVAKVSLVRG